MKFINKNKYLLISISLIILFVYWISSLFIQRADISKQHQAFASNPNIVIEDLSTHDEPFELDKINKRKPVERRDEKQEVKNLKAGEKISPVHKPSMPSGPKVAYLTFDDGPSPDISPQILDILKKNNIKATFFVVGKYIPDNKDVFFREIKEGHTIGNHSFSHDPENIYKTPQILLEDFKKCDEVIKEYYPDFKRRVARFPGGGQHRPREFKEPVKALGYKLVDWNTLTKDAEGPIQPVPVEELDKNMKQYFKDQQELIVLMHDSSGKQTTADYLPALIDFLTSRGYIFDSLK